MGFLSVTVFFSAFSMVSLGVIPGELLFYGNIISYYVNYQGLVPSPNLQPNSMKSSLRTPSLFFEEVTLLLDLLLFCSSSRQSVFPILSWQT